MDDRSPSCHLLFFLMHSPRISTFYGVHFYQAFRLRQAHCTWGFHPTGSRHGSFSACQGMVVLDPREMIGWHDVDFCFLIVCLFYLWEQGNLIESKNETFTGNDWCLCSGVGVMNRKIVCVLDKLTIKLDQFWRDRVLHQVDVCTTKSCCDAQSGFDIGLFNMWRQDSWKIVGTDIPCFVFVC